MKWRRARCISPAALERGFWSGDEDVRDHAAGCDRCGPVWAEIARLARAGRELAPPPSPPERREEIRAALLSQEPRRDRAAPRRPRPGRGFAARPVATAAFAAGAAIALGWWLWPDGGEPGAARRRAQVLDHGGASYLVASVQPDEIIRLVDGTLTIEVGALGPGERFRVMTGDAEIDVAGAALDVTATRDRLAAVRVMRGAVEVRAQGTARRAVTSGQTWTAPVERATDSAAAAATGNPAATGAPGAGAATGAATGAARGTATAAIDRAGPPRPEPRRRRGRRSALDPRAPEPEPPPASQTRTDADAGAAPAARSPAQQAFDDGWTAIRAGDFDVAAAAFDRAASISINPTTIEDAVFWGAVSLARDGKAAGAIRAFESFLEAYPGSARVGEASVMLGWLLLERGDHGSAERRFRAAAGDRSPRVRTSAAAGLEALAKARRRVP
ncbi:MAG TPA: tetratricopeptide repeat protein [Kofleriaceae bacterium]|nr:tetratricopeptide repeat protein [Kofleriaceae bacterium]